MTTPATCTCQTACAACGPSGTGCTCLRGTCKCGVCVNAPHSTKCECGGSGEGCPCTTQGKVCTCESK